jgi:hypothetical protein
MLDTTTARPPRPLIPAPELLAIALQHGIAGHVIKAITVLPDTDVLIEQDTGARLRVCTVPDGAGRTGLLVDHVPGGYKVGNMRDFVPRVGSGGPGEPWTVADLDWLADKINVPGGVNVVDGWSGMRGWLLTGEDATSSAAPRQPWWPVVAAYALWRAQARGRMRGVSLAEAASRSDLCAALRREVLDSGWLSAEAAAALDAR